MMILRELVFQTQEELMGGRILPQVLKLGGARRNLSIGDIQKVGQFIQTWRNGWLQWRSLVDNDDIFESRLIELLTLSPQFVRDYGVWGICGKASGLTYDSRIHQPHGAYTYLNLNFKFNFELRGDALARFYVAEKEVDWTLDILEESIRKIPEEGVVEGPTQNVELNFNPGFYSATAESAKGPVTALVRISKAGQVQNVRVFSPGQRVWPQIENLFIGQKSEDFILGWASLGYSGEEAEI
jgi:Ni,Fe-hydrogenase III large subunit